MTEPRWTTYVAECSRVVPMRFRLRTTFSEVAGFVSSPGMVN